MDREYSDIDFVGLSAQDHELQEALRRPGLHREPLREQATGAGQLQYVKTEALEGALEGRRGAIDAALPTRTRPLVDHVDVFIDVMRMDHDLDARDRLDLDDYAISPVDALSPSCRSADQQKDVHDVIALVKDVPLREEDDDLISPALPGRGVLAGLGPVPRHHHQPRARPPRLGLRARRRPTGACSGAWPHPGRSRGQQVGRWQLRAGVGERVAWRREIEDTDDTTYRARVGLAPRPGLRRRPGRAGYRRAVCAAPRREKTAPTGDARGGGDAMEKYSDCNEVSGGLPGRGRRRGSPRRGGGRLGTAGRAHGAPREARPCHRRPGRGLRALQRAQGPGGGRHGGGAPVAVLAITTCGFPMAVAGCFAATRQRLSAAGRRAPTPEAWPRRRVRAAPRPPANGITGTHARAPAQHRAQASTTRPAQEDTAWVSWTRSDGGAARSHKVLRPAKPAPRARRAEPPQGARRRRPRRSVDRGARDVRAVRPAPAHRRDAGAHAARGRTGAGVPHLCHGPGFRGLPQLWAGRRG